MQHVVRLLQIGIVLEEIAEARARKHANNSDGIDSEVTSFLEHAATNSARHRSRLKNLIEQFEANTVPFDRIEHLVEEQFEQNQKFDGVLYDQLCSEETAYKLYDDLIEILERSDLNADMDKEWLVSELKSLRTQEAEGAKEVTELMRQSVQNSGRVGQESQ